MHSTQNLTSFLLLLGAVSVVSAGRVDDLVATTLMQFADTCIPATQRQLDCCWHRHSITQLLDPRHQRQHLNGNTQYYSYTHPFNGPFPGLSRWAGTRKVKPIWILLKQETVSGSGISWAICKSAPRSRQITTPAPHHSVFYRLDALPAAQPTASMHWRQTFTVQETMFHSQSRKKVNTKHQCSLYWNT